MRKATRRLLQQYAVTLGATALMALAFRTWVVEPYRIPAHHPESGLLPGDFILVWKPNYAWALPGATREFHKGEVVLFQTSDLHPKIAVAPVDEKTDPQQVLGLAWRVWLSIEPQHEPLDQTAHWIKRLRWERLLKKIQAP